MGQAGRVRVAVVLSAGGLVGQAFHLGVLDALQEATGFDARRADVLVGSSAGALVAAGLAGGLSAADLRAEVEGRPLSPEGRRLRSTRRHLAVLPAVEQAAGTRGALVRHAVQRPWAVRPGALAASLLPAGRQRTDHISRSVQRLHGDRWPEQDLRVCAVRARDARRVVFGMPDAPSVDVGTAVAASCAIPAFFTPVQIRGDAYVDGGVHSPSNADVVLDDPPDLVLVCSSMSAAPGARQVRADLGVRLVVGRYLTREVRRLKRAGCTVVVLQPGAQDLPVFGVNPMDSTRAPAVLATATASTRARLQARPDLVELLSSAAR